MSFAVKLFVDKEKQRVLFAESDKDFVDLLLSFLTLPLGTIVWLLGKQSGVGCLDEVYKSVENLSVEHFQTEACKTMLLAPLNAAAAHCDRLKAKAEYINNPRSIYVCSNKTCHELVFSSVRNAICKACKGRQDMHIELPRNNDVAVGSDADGVFVKSGPKLIITDDLQVAPASTCFVFSLLDKFGLNGKSDIEEKFLHLGYSKIITLLKNTLISKEPLTDLYFDTVATPPDAVSLDELPANMFPKEETKGAQKFNAIKIKLIQTADNSTVLYAEVGNDFVDLIFGILTFPLGSIIKSYGQWPANACVDNLYLSVQGSAKECIREACRGLLVSPKLAPFFGCSINALQVEESDPKTVSQNKCCKCFKFGVEDKCGCCLLRQYKEINPKSTSGARDTSREYIKGQLRNFIVTNDLRIRHFSLATTLQVMRASKIPKEKLVEKELSLDRTQVLKMLRAAIATREALSSVLLPPKKKRHPHH